jgi:hypothetical protein
MADRVDSGVVHPSETAISALQRPLLTFGRAFHLEGLEKGLGVQGSQVFRPVPAHLPL